jgi:hypothetical protein
MSAAEQVRVEDVWLAELARRARRAAAAPPPDDLSRSRTAG